VSYATYVTRSPRAFPDISIVETHLLLFKEPKCADEEGQAVCDVPFFFVGAACRLKVDNSNLT
jgi:hypothetical protein